MTYSEFKEYLKKQKEILVENKTKLEHGAYIKFDKAKDKITKMTYDFIENIFENTQFGKYYEIMKVMSDPKRYSSEKAPLIRKVINALKENPKTKQVGEDFEKQFSNPELAFILSTPNTYMNRLDTYMYRYSNNNELYSEIQKEIKSVYIKEVKDLYVKGKEEDILDGFFEKLDSLEEQKRIKIDFDKLIPDEKNYKHVLEIGEEMDDHPYKEKIDIIKAENSNDKEYVDALEEANNIIILGDADLVKRHSEIAENEGEKSDLIRSQKIIEDIKQDEEIRDLFKTNDVKRLLVLKNTEASLETIKKLETKEIENHGFKDEKFVNDVVNLTNKMKKYGFYDDKEFKPEAQRKEYSLISLIKVAEEVRLAIESKNRESIIQKVKEYKEKEKQYDELIKDVKKINDGPNFVSNVSSTRVAYAPYKYRSDYVNVSKLSALYISIGFCNVTGTDYKEFIKNPIKEFKRIGLEFVTNKSNTLRVLKEKTKDPIALLNALEKGIGNPDIHEAQQKDNTIFYGTGRAIDALASLYPDRKEANKLFKEIQYTLIGSLGKCTTFSAAIQQTPFIFTVPNISNALLMSEKDNLFELMPGYDDMVNPVTQEKFTREFDRKKALENVDPEILIDKLVNVRENYKGNKANIVNDAIVTTVRDVIETNKNLSDVEKDFLTKISDNTPIPKIHLSNYHTEKFLEDFNKKELKNSNVDNLLNEIAKARKEYDSRSFFAKIFYSGVKKQGNLIDNMTKKLTDAGIKKEDINMCVQVINGKADPIKATNSIQTIRNTLAPKSIEDLIDTKATEVLNEDLSKEFENTEVINNNKLIDGKEQELVNELGQTK